jgi:DNA-directed RNA polymerase specialized sigma24 family protein
VPHAQQAFVALDAFGRDDLVRLAALLAADDRTDAGQLARAALVAAGRSRPGRVDLVEAARTELVRRVLGRRPRDEQGTDDWVRATPSAGADGSEGLRRALARLPVRTRVAVVLARWAGSSDDDVAAVLRSPVVAARTEIAAGSATLRSALHPPSAYRRPVDTYVALDADRELRDALDGLARSLASSASPVPPPEQLHREATRARRRRWWLVAVAVCCGALLVAVVVLPGGDARTPPEGPDAAADPSAAPRDIDVTDLPTRGPLADDAAFLAGLRALPWRDDTDPAWPIDVPTTPESRRVLFAGDVPGARWALLVGEPAPVEPSAEEPGVVVYSDELLMAWFVGPPGAEPEQMSLGSYPYGVAPDMVPAFLDPRTGTLVVVAAPGDAVEVSQRVDIDADGEDTRTWMPVEMDDGIGIAQLEPVDVPWMWSARYRVLRDGRQTISSSLDGPIVPPEEQDFGVDIDFPEPPTEEGRDAAEWAAGAVLSATGRPSDDVDVTARALVQVPEPALGTLAVVTVELPSGAVVVSAQWARQTPEGPGGGVDCGLEVQPAGAAPERGLLAVLCPLYDPVSGRELDDVLLVVAPPQVDRVRFYGGDSTFLGEETVPDDGILLVPGPDGLTDVEAVTSGGVLLGRTGPLGRWMPAE